MFLWKRKGLVIQKALILEHLFLSPSAQWWKGIEKRTSKSKKDAEKIHPSKYKPWIRMSPV